MSTNKLAGLREMLASETPTSDTKDPTPVDVPAPRDSTPPAPEPAASAAVPTPHDPPKKRAAVPTTKPSMSGKSPKKRSNITLSEDLVDRLVAARDEHRWTLVHLFETALDSWSPISDVEAGRRLAATGPRHRQQGVRLSEDNFDQLDQLGEQWRMNRSETSTIVLEQRLDELGL